MRFSIAILLVLLIPAGCSGPALKDKIHQLQTAETGPQRLEAAQALGEAVRQAAADSRAPEPRTLAALEGALRDRDSAVRLEAALALAWIGHETGMTVPVLQEAIRQHGILTLHRVAEEALIFADRSSESALAALRTHVQAAWPDAPALDVTGSGGRTQAQTEKLVAELAARLSGPTAASMAALGELERLGPDAAPAVPAIAALLNKPDEPSRCAAALETLGRLGTTAYPALRVVTEACYAVEPAVRAAAVRAVLRLDPNTGSSVYFQYMALSDVDPGVRRAAARALADFGPIAKECVNEPVTPERLKAIYWPRTLAMRMIGPAIPRLRVALKDADPGVRAEAARTLGRISPDAGNVIPDLVAAGADGDPQVRAAAAWALGELPAATPEAAGRLRGLLNDPHPAARAEALLALVRVARDDTPLPPLLENASRDPAPEVSRALLLALNEVGAGNLLASKPLTETLLALVHHADPGIRAAAAWTVGRTHLRTDVAVRELTRALADPSPEVAGAAAEALGSMGPTAEDAVPALERLAGQGAPDVRYSATLALGWIDRQSTATLQRVMAVLREPSFWQPGDADPLTTHNSQLTTHNSPLAPHSGRGQEALLVLGWRGPAAAAAAPLLAGILRERRNPAPVQLLAAMALESVLGGGLPPEAALEPIFKTVRTQTAQRQLQAATGLIWLGPKAAPALPELIRLVQNHNCAADLRVAAAAAIGAVGAAAAGQIPALAAVLGGEPDPQVKAAVAAVLGGMGPGAKAAVAPLIAALGDPDSGVRQAAALALGRIARQDPAAPAALVRALGDGDQRVRLAAAMALGAFGAAARPAQPMLQSLATADPDLLVRQAAAAAFKKTGSADVSSAPASARQ